jgi:hypothetical protein|tara:strand:- start:38 stop:259 length:222 start_codon:yes stop_codon:yes gene_type:complete
MVEDFRRTSAEIINAITTKLIQDGTRSVLSFTNGRNSVKESALVYVPPREAVRSIQPVEIVPKALCRCREIPS